jgi:plastocyanin
MNLFAKRHRPCWNISTLAALGIFTVALVAGCGGGHSGTSDAVAHKPAPTKTLDAATTGSISGHVTLNGTAPTMRAIDMSAEPSCASQHSTPLIPPMVSADDKGNLANVVVYVKSGVEDYGFRAPSQTVALTQKGCMYEPHVVAVMAGQKLDVSNNDQAIHNVFLMSQVNQPSNRSAEPGSPPIEEVLTTPELAIPVKCNVHPWMKGYVFVFDHPYYAITKADGTFTLPNLPPGTYTIAAWQEMYGTTEQTVTIAPKQAATTDFVFKAQ